MNRSLTIVYASTSGHTEYVVDVLIDVLDEKGKSMRVIKQRAELTKPEDLQKADILLLATSSWNTGNVEGQLNPYMHDLLMNRAATVDLGGKPCAAIGLGDERYFFLAKAADRLTDYVKTHQGQLMLPALKVINEPYGQEEKVKTWAAELYAKIDSLPAKAHS
jgi:flavodoxin I